MSTGLLYHGFGVRGYQYVRSEYVCKTRMPVASAWAIGATLFGRPSHGWTCQQRHPGSELEFHSLAERA